MSHADNNFPVEKEVGNWTSNQIKVLIETRFKYEKEFSSGKRKKTSIWSAVMKDIKDIDPQFPFSTDEAIRKYNNLVITYKRIKKRNNESGRDATKWEFFSQFNAVYGEKHYINPPKEIQCSTIIDVDTGSNEDSETNDAAAAGTKRCSKRPKNDITELTSVLKEIDANEERRHQDNLKIDKERVNVLFEIKDILKEVLNK